MENKEPSGDGTAEQEAAGEEYKQEAEQFLKLHREDKVFTPSELFAAVGAYLLFVGAVTGVGMLASYSHHETTANVFLLISIALLLIGVIGALWYLLVTFREKPRDKPDSKQGLLARIYQTAIGAFLLRITNTRIAKFILYLLYIVLIGFYIAFMFPRAPRLSLAFIAFFILMLGSVAILDVATVLRKEHDKDTLMLAKAVVGLYEAIKLQQTFTKDVAEITSKHMDATALGNSEVHKLTMAAIDATNRSVDNLYTALLPDTPKPDQLDATHRDDEENGN